VLQEKRSSSHLQWLMQKDLLGQDALLVSSTSSIGARRLALAYLELTHRPVEVLVLSRDTTDADLKQRRVLVNNNHRANQPPQQQEDGHPAIPMARIQFVDQAPVRAARFGHTLLLDGLQYAERNVLASLNNLLENREMPLDDGTILTNQDRSLLRNVTNTDDDDTASRFVPVHPDFRVIALYNAESSSSSSSLEESSLDPPVRSRFSIRRIDAPELDGSLAIVPHVVKSISNHALSTLARVMELFPDQPMASLLLRRYPFQRDPATRRTFERLCQEMKISSKAIAGHADGPVQMKRLDGTWFYNNRIVMGGPEESQSFSRYIGTTTSEAALTALLEEHAADRHLLVTTSSSGTGKSMLAEQFARLLGYGTPLLFPLYPDLTARDLLLRRSSSDDELSPLVTAALTGRLCILDNVHTISADLLATLQSLLIDGQLWLPDGRHIVAHEAFRVVALGLSNDETKVLTATTTLDMFSWIAMKPLTEDCYRRLLRPHNHSFSEQQLEQLLKFRKMVTDDDDGFVGSTLSLRDLKRIVRQGNVMELKDSIRATMVVDLMPKSRRDIIDDCLHRSGVAQQQHCRKGGGSVTSSKVKEQMTITTKEVHIGKEAFPRREPKNVDLVPRPFFYNIPSQLAIIQILFREWANGERSFLLLGNQGTGKNKICDRVCELMNHEREYIQLHRDSTIGQLTIAPSIDNGKIVWIDSALIRAVQHGRALVVDEADKAPSEVVAVLKSLVEDGQMLLADGRRILREPSGMECGRWLQIKAE
jgi:von Willebrand factor A domain-containing protein 8